MSGNDAHSKPQDIPLILAGPPAYPAFSAGYQQQPPASASVYGQGHSQLQEQDAEEELPEEQKAASISVEHLNLEFKQCFREHSSTKTWPQLYEVTGFIYKYTKLVVYHFFVILFGIFFAILWAMINGLTAFIHTWIWNPGLKVILLWVWATSPLVTEPLRAICRPLIDMSARILRQCRIHATVDGTGWKWSNTHSEATQA